MGSNDMGNDSEMKTITVPKDATVVYYTTTAEAEVTKAADIAAAQNKE